MIYGDSDDEHDDTYDYDEEEDEEDDESYKPIPKNEEEAFAIKYLSNRGDFLYAQAIKDNFEIPCYLPSEKKKREIEFSQIIMKIAKKNIPLSFKIWSWCLEKFGPYSLYDNFVKTDLSKDVIDELYAFPDEYITKLVYYMTDNPDFCKTIIVESNELIFIIPELIEAAIYEKLYATAENIFKIELEQLVGQWEETNKFIECVIYACENYDEFESMVYFRDNLFPYVKTINDGMVQDEIDDWEKEINNYIEEMKEECQEEFNRENIWRELVSEANKNILDPSIYATKQEYYEELNVKLQQIRQQEIMQQQQEYLNDKTIYTYCGVLLPFSPKAYSYRTEDETIQIGDTVIVPVGEDDEEKTGTVVSIGKYARVGVPYPVEKTKFILRKENDLR